MGIAQYLVFNIFANINLRLFTREEAQQLIDNSLAHTNVNFSEAEVEKILQIGGLHPYFLKVACSFMFEAYRRNLDAGRRLEFLSKQFWQEATPHLEYCWSNLDDAEQIVLTALALLERQGKVGDRSFSVKRLKDLYENSSVQLMNLEKHGLVVAQNDTYCLFNTSFEDWIAQEVLNSKPDQIEYKVWLESNQGLIESLSRASQREVKEVLPQISEKYRKKFVQWMGNPKNLLAIAQVLRRIAGF